MFLDQCMFIALMLAAVATSTSSIVKDQLILKHAPACNKASFPGHAQLFDNNQTCYTEARAYCSAHQ